MTPKELIESGLLELYVSGTLNETDSKLIANAAESFTEIKDEITKIEKAFILALENEGKEISSTAKNNIFNALGVANTSISNNTVLLPKKNRTTLWATAAMFALLISSLFIILILSKAKNELRAEQIQTKIDIENLQNRISFLQQTSDKALADMEIFRSHDYKKIMMAEVQGSHHQAACVYWNPITHKLFVDNCGLVNPGIGKTYQLWAMKNGKPISVGLFNQEMFNKGLQEFALIDSAESFAVTIENAGGSTLPTLTALQVLGKV